MVPEHGGRWLTIFSKKSRCEPSGPPYVCILINLGAKKEKFRRKVSGHFSPQFAWWEVSRGKLSPKTFSCKYDREKFRGTESSRGNVEKCVLILPQNKHRFHSPKHFPEMFPRKNGTKIYVTRNNHRYHSPKHFPEKFPRKKGTKICHEKFRQ